MIKIPTFLKWIGGKRRLISQIDPHLPDKIESYYDPFLGAGSMFFYIKQKYPLKKCVISDINRDLIDVYKSVRDNPKQLMKFLKFYVKNNSESFYYKIRKKFNEHEIHGLNRSAAFIYMNKTCFNGVFRVNSKGEFNVPYGKRKNPEIFNKETILFASKLLQGVDIRCQDYEKIISEIKDKDFLYLDPCYDPLKRTSFANYTEKRFCDKDSERLRIFISKVRNFGARILLSNNFVDSIRKRYPLDQGYDLKIVYCPRSINSNATGRGKIKEYLIKAGY